MMYEFEINWWLYNPLFYYLITYLRDVNIRNIILYGGSSSGKSYSVAQAIITMTFFDGENTIIFRKVGASITKTIYEDFKVAARQLGVFSMLKFKDSMRQIVFPNGAKIDFQGLDDPEKIKGISNYKRVVLEELSEYDEEDDKQIRKRLRGKEGQQRIMMFNPIRETHWIKTNIFDIEEWHDIPMGVNIDGLDIPLDYCTVKTLRKNSPRQIINPRSGEIEEHPSDTIAIQTTYLNNFWVVGSPCGTFGFYDRQCVADFEKDRIYDPDYYNVYALGEWGVIRTGSEFFGSFNRASHISSIEYDPDLPIHISVDNNVLPYITTTFWQISYENGTQIRQIDEVCAGNPNNTVRKAAKLVADKLKAYFGKMSHGQMAKCQETKVYIHGDASTRTANTIDEQKRSFLDLFIDTLQKEGIEVVDKVGNKNPSVPMTGEFINAIYEGLVKDTSITISEQCRKSIEDYLAVQKDENGAMSKIRIKDSTTKQSYEEHGHISDTKRYLVTDILRKEFILFSNRRKRNLYGAGYINYFNPSINIEPTSRVVYAIPNINGKFVLVYGQKCLDKWHVTDVCFSETASIEEIKSRVLSFNADRIILECSKSYYLMAREIRDESTANVRAIHESTDLPRRIAAVSDYVAKSIRFDERGLMLDEYSAFLDNLMDYSNNRENIEASATLSGFIEAVLKLGL